MRSSALVSSVALAFASVSHADIFQYADCDGDGSLLLTELDAEPFVDLSGLYLECADLRFADLSDADLTGANLSDADLRGADLSNADLTNANLSFAILFFAILSGANLSGADLSEANLFEADLTNANLSNADLSEANLFEADLTNANLSNADLIGANLSFADLTGAILTGVQSGGIVGTPNVLPTEWILRSGYLVGPGANLSGEYLVGANLSGANLSGADLSGADLSGANLTNANLSGADLTNANLTGADLTNADLTGADLTNANLTGAIGNVNVDISDLAVDQTGSCCTNLGCASISESNCSAMGGTWTEGGSCDDCQPAADDCPADVDGDGTIGFSDVLVILNDWGVCP